MKNHYIISILLFICFVGLYQEGTGQDMNYSQYFSTPIYYNPAYTGINTGVRARFLFRDQWPKLPIPYKSYFFSADLGDRNLPGAGGLGIMVNSDNPGHGMINNLSAALTIGVRIPITEFMVSQIGIKAGIMQRKVNWDDLLFADALDEKYGNIYQTSFIPSDANKVVVPDFGIGGVLQFITPEGNASGNIGFAVDHLFRPDVSFLSTGSSPYPRKFVGQFDMVFSTGGGNSSSTFNNGAGDPLKINVGAIYQNQADMNSLQVGLNLLKFNIYLGAWYKSTLTSLPNSAVALVAGYRYTFYENMSIKFIYSYDLQISGVLNGTGGAHEIGLVLEFDKLQIFGGGGGGGFVPGGGGNRIRGGPMECPNFY
ncbi:MAG: PorP/SprF family type IX secretion system membrane protein [Bacteroidales bacterium]|nr:PorP/SprF family type IX secretion system membrane protein [Bacteroidales bacterium]MDD4602219.1 PorP/SprF family type IX secretion system membrane protein [Bacteroidales bacterium]